MHQQSSSKIRSNRDPATDRRPARAPGHADLAEEFLDRQTPLSRIRNILHRYPAVSPALVLLIAVVVFGLLNDVSCGLKTSP